MSIGERPASRRLPAALALALVLAPGCGSPTEPGTTESASQATTDDASTAGPTTAGPTTDATSDPTTAGPGTDASTSDATSDATTDATTDGPGACAELCQSVSGCTDEVSLEQCLTDCEAADPLLRGCLVACNQPECPDLLMCTTLCAQPGNPNATPYDNCDGDSSSCLPGVVYCSEGIYNGGDLHYTACTPFCDEEGNCPVPETGNATPVCEVNDTPALCSLDCSDGQQCPDGMVCTPGGWCMWPVE